MQHGFSSILILREVMYNWKTKRKDSWEEKKWWILIQKGRNLNSVIDIFLQAMMSVQSVTFL